MGEVVEIPQRGPWLSGSARCLDCGITWEAVAAVGTCWMECPSCGTKRGVMVNPCGADVGDSEWTCKCGCDVFKIIAKSGKFHSLMCLRCGLPQEF